MDHLMRRRNIDRSRGVLGPSINAASLPSPSSSPTPSPIPFASSRNVSLGESMTRKSRSPSPWGSGPSKGLHASHNELVDSVISTTNRALTSMSEGSQSPTRMNRGQRESEYQGNQSGSQTYKSKALEYEVKISEALYKKRAAPHPDRTAACMSVFYDFVHDDSMLPFRRCLMTLYEEISKSIYSDTYLTAATSTDSSSPIGKSPFFLAVKRLEQEKQDIQVSKMRLMKDIKEQEVNYTNLVDELSRLKEVISERDQEIHNLHIKENKIKSELSKVREQMMEVKKDRERFETLWAADHHRVDTLKKELDDTTNEFTLQLEEMRELNVNQVPRHQYERSQNKLMRITTEYQALEENHQELVDKYNQAISKLQENSKMVQDYEKKLSCTTPRPQGELYEVLFPVRDGSDDDSEDDSRNRDYMFTAPYVAKSTRDRFAVLSKSVEILRAEVTDLREKVAISTESVTKKIRSGRYFIGRGNGLHVPKYLRYVGRIPNRNMTRRELDGLMSEILEYKDRHEKNTGNEEPLQDSIYIFFQKKFGSQQAIAFCSYNMMNALKRYLHESDCRLFYRVLKTDYPFSLYTQCELELSKIRTLVREIIRTVSSKMVKKELLTRIKENFPLKSEQDMNDIKEALGRDKLFLSQQYEKMLREGPFIQEVKDQFLYAFEDYVTGLGEVLSTMDRRKTGRLSLREIGEGLRQFDPDKSIKELRGYLAAGSGTNVRDMDPSTVVEIPNFLKRLTKSVACQRSLPSDKPAD
eukprot:TRINITY_DN5625_c0_g1_i7.p1 TRINITY_DN5625_c0_g1~~TRINITY_DN5625_c0_g1_i7.p1  ORF type:complete len:754 (+),score=132.74 TRINITY_DN5625_c0_g1_i7:64-2325(+)